MAIVVMGNSSIYQQEDGQQQYDDTQYYDPQYYNQGPSIVEIPETDYVNFVDPVENTNILYYESSNLSFQSINCQQTNETIIIQNIPTRKVQTIACEINGKVAKLTIDSGSEGDCIRQDVCTRLAIPVLPLDSNDNKVPTQADGYSPLEIVGQAKFIGIRGKVTFQFIGYVAKTLNADILCGGPFMERNKLVQELHNKRIIIDGKHVFLENSPFCPSPIPEVSVRQVSDHKPSNFRYHTTEPPDLTNPEQEEIKTDANKDREYIAKIDVGKNVPKKVIEKLHAIHSRHSIVFNSDLSSGFNGSSGNFDVNFNFRGGVPPTPNYDTVPNYNNSKYDILKQAEIDSLEDQGIVIKVANSNIIPEYAARSMLSLKNSVWDLAPGVYDKLTVKEKLKYNRFILAIIHNFFLTLHTSQQGHQTFLSYPSTLS